MNVPGHEPESQEPHGGKPPEDHQPHGGKWDTIRYAIQEWGTTVRLLIVILAISIPYLIVWLTHR